MNKRCECTCVVIKLHKKVQNYLSIFAVGLVVVAFSKVIWEFAHVHNIQASYHYQKERSHFVMFIYKIDNQPSKKKKKKDRRMLNEYGNSSINRVEQNISLKVIESKLQSAIPVECEQFFETLLFLIILFYFTKLMKWEYQSAIIKVE